MLTISYKNGEVSCVMIDGDDCQNLLVVLDSLRIGELDEMPYDMRKLISILLNKGGYISNDRGLL